MLSIPWDQRKSVYDFVVVGSGYGGAITAARIATAPDDPEAPLLARAHLGLVADLAETLQHLEQALTDERRE